jgi:hypothetical protein
MTDLSTLNKAVQAAKPGTAIWQHALNAWVNEATAEIAPTPPPGWSVAPPVPPITDITNPTGLGLNVVGGKAQAFSDYVSAGTYDSAVLLGPPEGGSSFTRFHLDKAASIGQGPGYGRHALYAKGPNVSVTDWYSRSDPTANDIGSQFSIRYAGFTALRFDVGGLWGISFFDDDPNHRPGAATFTDGLVAFTSVAAMIVDAQFVYSITLDTVAFTGPNDLLLTVDSGSVKPIIVARAVTINGKPATAANFAGVPAGNLHIS